MSSKHVAASRASTGETLRDNSLETELKQNVKLLNSESKQTHGASKNTFRATGRL